MDSNNQNNKNYGEEQQQLRGSAQKLKLNELANDGHGQPAAAGREGQHQPLKNLSKQNCVGQQGNDALENLHLESLTREELIKMIQKQLAYQNEAHNKPLEAVKNKAEEKVRQQAQEMTTKIEELKTALLASQQKVEQLTAEKADQLNVEHQQKHLDSAKKAEEFSLRIVQLEQENAEVNEDLGKKLAEIVEMHKEMEEKSAEVAEKAKQIDALLMQLNESSHQHQMPNEQQMKIQLSLETWYDWLAFVPRHQLAQIVPMIGHRKFGSIVQKFLHEYGEIKIDRIQIVAPYDEDPSGPPSSTGPSMAKQSSVEISNGRCTNSS